MKAFDSAVRSAGYKTLVYGSAAFVFKNPDTTGGVWGAQWDGHASVPTGWAAKQYASDGMLGKSWDLSVVADSTPLWDTHDTHLVEEDMPYGTVPAGKGNRTGESLPRGRYKTVGLAADNGLNGEAAYQVRVAVLRADSGGHEGAWDVSTQVVDGTKHGQAVVHFVDPANTVAVSFERLDTGKGEVWYEVS